MRLIRLLKQDLSREVDDWVSEDIITEAQKDRILAKYGIEPGSQSSIGYQILVGLGLLFAGLSLITLIGANWDEIPRHLRTALLFVLTAATQLYGWYCYRKDDESRAVGMFFLGNLFFGASIILIAQIYHLGEHMPDGIFYWALGCLPFVVITSSRVLALQTLALGYIWFFVESSLGYLPVLFPVFLAACVSVLIRKSSVLLFVATASGAMLWLEYVAAWFWTDHYRLNFSVEHVPLTASLFALAYGFSHYLMQRVESHYQDYGAVLAAWCLRFAIIFMLVLTFEDPWRSMIRADWVHVLPLIAACLVLWVLGFYLAFRANHYYSLTAFGILLVVTGVCLGMVEQTLHAPLFQVVYNLAVIALGVWLVIRGIRHRISHYFWTGIVSVLAIALFRYFDLIGSYVGGSILFLLIAAILLGAARYWRALDQGSSGEPQATEQSGRHP